MESVREVPGDIVHCVLDAHMRNATAGEAVRLGEAGGTVRTWERSLLRLWLEGLPEGKPRQVGVLSTECFDFLLRYVPGRRERCVADGGGTNDGQSLLVAEYR
jgi:hypothetical protein